MQLVIEIPEETVANVRLYDLFLCPRDKEYLVNSIKNGSRYKECKTGYWIKLLNGNVECSECWVEHPIDTNYCPWCGAKMEGVK